MTKKITTLAAEFVDLFMKKIKKGKFSYLLIRIKWNCVAMHFSHSGSEMTPGIHHYPNIYLFVSHTVIMGNSSSAVLLEESP